jgi:hypothetical protein
VPFIYRVLTELSKSTNNLTQWTLFSIVFWSTGPYSGPVGLGVVAQSTVRRMVPERKESRRRNDRSEIALKESSSASYLQRTESKCAR